MEDLLLSRRSPKDLFGNPINSPHPPSWFNKDAILQENFDSETYITDLTALVPIHNLRSQLRFHHSSLKHELLELINGDYTDFVNLSTELGDVDGAILRIRAPLTDLRQKILQFRETLESSLAELQSRLRMRAEASSARRSLELLLDALHVVSKVEKLIKELPDVRTSDESSLQPEHAESRSHLRETQSMLLERIASEVKRLKFYIAPHAQNHTFIENLEKRIQNVSLLLYASLRHCFVDALEHRDENTIYNCLRAYASIDNPKGAEEIFRITVVSPSIAKIILHSTSQVISGASRDELGADYQRIMEFIEKGCRFLLEISSSAYSGLHLFDFLANSILKEVLLTILKRKPGAFSPGRPTEFLKNYKSTLGFLAHLEGYCASRSAVSKFRSEAVYIQFLKQWNLGVYFSLRFQGIAGALDSALMVTAVIPVESSHSDQGKSLELTLKQSITLLESLRSCWRDDILVFSCSDKFLRLSLQLLSRYTTWLSSGVEARRMGNTGSIPGTEWAISAVPEDFIYILHDIDCLVTQLSGDYLESVLQLLSSCPTEVLDLVKQSIFQGAKSLQDVVPQIMKTMTESLVQKSVVDLRQLEGITATYSMPNKPLPVAHSPYVPGLLHPLKAFLDGERATTYLSGEARHELLRSITEEITDHYYKKISSVRGRVSALQRWQGAQRGARVSSDVADKICMQLFLDVEEYGRNLATLGVEPVKIPTYPSLWQCVAPPGRQNEF